MKIGWLYYKPIPLSSTSSSSLKILPTLQYLKDSFPLPMLKLFTNKNFFDFRGIHFDHVSDENNFVVSCVLKLITEVETFQIGETNPANSFNRLYALSPQRETSQLRELYVWYFLKKLLFWKIIWIWEKLLKQISDDSHFVMSGSKESS